MTLEELKSGLAKQGAAVPQKEVQALIDSLDMDANGSIDYEEFLAATVQMSQLQVRAMHGIILGFYHRCPCGFAHGHVARVGVRGEY